MVVASFSFFIYDKNFNVFLDATTAFLQETWNNYDNVRKSHTQFKQDSSIAHRVQQTSIGGWKYHPYLVLSPQHWNGNYEFLSSYPNHI